MKDMPTMRDMPTRPKENLKTIGRSTSRGSTCRVAQISGNGRFMVVKSINDAPPKVS